MKQFLNLAEFDAELAVETRDALVEPIPIPTLYCSGVRAHAGRDGTVHLIIHADQPTPSGVMESVIVGRYAIVGGAARAIVARKGKAAGETH